MILLTGQFTTVVLEQETPHCATSTLKQFRIGELQGLFGGVWLVLCCIVALLADHSGSIVPSCFCLCRSPSGHSLRPKCFYLAPTIALQLICMPLLCQAIPTSCLLQQVPTPKSSALSAAMLIVHCLKLAGKPMCHSLSFLASVVVAIKQALTADQTLTSVEASASVAWGVLPTTFFSSPNVPVSQH